MECTGASPQRYLHTIPSEDVIWYVNVSDEPRSKIHQCDQDGRRTLRRPRSDKTPDQQSQSC